MPLSVEVSVFLVAQLQTWGLEALEDWEGDPCVEHHLNRNKRIKLYALSGKKGDKGLRKMIEQKKNNQKGKKDLR